MLHAYTYLYILFTNGMYQCVFVCCLTLAEGYGTVNWRFTDLMNLLCEPDPSSKP